MANYTAPLSEGNSTEYSTCPEPEVHLALLATLLLTGTVANILLLLFVKKEWKKSKTPDKILIVNLAVADILGLVVGVPLKVTTILNMDSFFQCDLRHLGMVQFATQATCHFANLGTLAVVSRDRFDALTKFPHERLLTLKRARFVVVGLWFLSVLSGTLTVTGPMELSCPAIDNLPSQTSGAVIGRILIVSVWMCVCITLTCHWLSSAARRIRKHRQQIQEMFGGRQALMEVRFTKTVAACSVTYLLFWLPCGIAVFVWGVLGSASHCFVLWTNSLEYTSFAAMPLIYMAMDRRLNLAVLCI